MTQDSPYTPSAVANEAQRLLQKTIKLCIGQVRLHCRAQRFESNLQDSETDGGVHRDIKEGAPPRPPPSKMLLAGTTTQEGHGS